MKTIFNLSVLLLLATTANSQSLNPFESIGKKGKIITLSNGKYVEVYSNDSLQKIGSVIMNMNTGEIYKYLEIDTVYSEATLDPTIISRWYSVDPLQAKYAGASPYTFSGNNPILFVDHDGRDYGLQINHDSKTIIVKATYYTVKGDKQSHNSAVEATQLWNNQSDKYVYKAGQESYNVKFELNVIEVDKPRSEINKDRIPLNVANENGLTQLTPGATSNTYEVKSDNDGAFTENQNGVTNNGVFINVKASRSNTETGAHEVGHTLGLEHFDTGLLTESSEDPNRSKSIGSNYVGGIIQNALQRNPNSSAGVGTTQTSGTAPADFNSGKVEEKK